MSKANIARQTGAKQSGAKNKGVKSSDAKYTATRIQDRVNELGRQITKASNGRRLDIVVTMDRGFMFGADLVRAIETPIVLHFLREDVSDVEQGWENPARGFLWKSRDDDRQQGTPGIEGARRAAGGRGSGERDHSGISAAAYRREQAALTAVGGAAGQGLETPGGFGTRLLWLQNCIQSDVGRLRAGRHKRNGPKRETLNGHNVI